MLTAKDYFKKDIENFFNISEFAEPHKINNNIINVVIDSDKLEERTKKEYDGIYVGDLLYFAKEESFIKQPSVDSVQTFDGILYKVFDVRKDNGIYEIILKRNGS